MICDPLGLRVNLYDSEPIAINKNCDSELQCDPEASRLVVPANRGEVYEPHGSFVNRGILLFSDHKKLATKQSSRLSFEFQ